MSHLNDAVIVGVGWYLVSPGTAGALSLFCQANKNQSSRKLKLLLDFSTSSVTFGTKTFIENISILFRHFLV